MKVNFNKDKHEYTKNGLVYTSVTKIVSSFHKPFDSDYWSTYKALKDIITIREGEEGWARYKKSAGGWKEVVKFYNRKGYAFKDQIVQRKNEYLQAWDVKGHIARTAGTAVHKWKENTLNHKGKIPHTTPSGDTVVLEVSQEELLSTQDFKSNRLYPELIISNDEFQVAGTSDKVEKIGQLVNISDYKTSEKVTKEAFGEQLMFPPINLPDANFYHYTMQLSLYGWMLEQQGYVVGTLTIEQLFPPYYREEDAVFHSLPYRGDLVRPMLEEYRRKNPL